MKNSIKRSMMKPLFLSVILVAASSASASIVTSQVTLDFSAESTEQVIWMGFDFESGKVLAEPRFEAPNWHLRMRQGYVSTNGGSTVLVKTSDFASVKEAPADEASYLKDQKYDPSGPAPEDVYNKTLMGWYDYFFWEGHLLAPHPHVYVVRTSDGHYAKVQFLDYVKNGKAIRVVKEKDFLGREKWKQKGMKVTEDDGKVHVVLQVKYNTVVGARELE